MGKICKLVHVNDGSAVVLENRGFHFVEEYEWASEYLDRLLSEGWEVKHMVSEVSPAIQGNGVFTFYKSGFTFYLERNDTQHKVEVETGPEGEFISFAELDDELDELISNFFESDEDCDGK